MLHQTYDRHPSRAIAHVVVVVVVVLLLGRAAPASAASSFGGGFETGRFRPWDRVQYEEDRPLSDSFQIVTDPVRQGSYAAKIIVRQGYSRWGYGEDTELAWHSNEGQGDEFYYAWSTLFPTDWVAPHGWGIFMQWHARLDTAPPLTFNARRDSAEVVVRGGLTDGMDDFAYTRSVPLLRTLSKGRWNDFVVRVRWSASADGAVEVWHRVEGRRVFRKLVALTGVPTLQRNARGIATNYTLWGLYRGSYCPQPTQLGCTGPNGTQPTNVLYQDGFTRGTSFERVARSAFRETPPFRILAPTPAKAPALRAARWTSVGRVVGRVDPGCRSCRVSLGNGAVAARVAGGAETGDTAYGLLGLRPAGRWASGIYLRDEVRLGRATLAGNLVVAQLRDVRQRIMLELYVAGSDRTLRLWSPPGALHPTAVNVSTGAVVPTGSVRGLRIALLLRRGRALSLWVDGTRAITLALRGHRTGAPGSLRIGIDHYDGPSADDPVDVSHAGVALAPVSQAPGR